MLSKKKMMTSAVSLFLITCTSSSFAIEKDIVNVDQLFKNANLTKLIGKKNPLNLEAQLSDPTASTRNVNEFNDFIAIGVIHSEATVMTEFDKNQKILNKVTYDVPWLGVDEYKQKELPTLPLQDGLQLAQTCMAQQGDPVSDKIARLVIYKTINTQEIIYDYVFKSSHYPNSQACEEILYSPATGKCQRGMRVACHHDITDPMRTKKSQ